MERMLEKMAKQLCAYDQMSLSQLWPKYEAKVRAFEPTKKWEEAMLAFCLIQAVRMKNQLFNYHLASTATPHHGEQPPIVMPIMRHSSEQSQKDNHLEKHVRKATVLHFPPNKNKK